MKNVQMSVEGNILTIKVDLSVVQGFLDDAQVEGGYEMLAPADREEYDVAGGFKHDARPVARRGEGLGGSPMPAYVSMMAPRLVELRRVLKSTGSIYLHCDPTSSAHLRLLMDAVFGPENFRNEIIWYYYNKMHDRRKKLFPRATDTLLFYVKDVKADYRAPGVLPERLQRVEQVPVGPVARFQRVAHGVVRWVRLGDIDGILSRRAWETPPPRPTYRRRCKRPCLANPRGTGHPSFIGLPDRTKRRPVSQSGFRLRNW